MRMAIELADDRRQRLVLSVQRFHSEEFDEEISPYRAEQLLDFFLAALGPHVYNQAVQDARGFMQRRLEELDGEVYAADVF
jgi:uncharacterized protein (DUF2164 family)